MHLLIDSWPSFLGFFSGCVREAPPRWSMAVAGLRPVGDLFLAVLVKYNDASPVYVISHLLVLYDWASELFYPPVDTHPSLLISRRARPQTVFRQETYIHPVLYYLDDANLTELCVMLRQRGSIPFPHFLHQARSQIVSQNWGCSAAVLELSPPSGIIGRRKSVVPARCPCGGALGPASFDRIAVVIGSFQGCRWSSTRSSSPGTASFFSYSSSAYL